MTWTSHYAMCKCENSQNSSHNTLSLPLPFIHTFLSLSLCLSHPLSLSISPPLPPIEWLTLEVRGLREESGFSVLTMFELSSLSVLSVATTWPSLRMGKRFVHSTFDTSNIHSNFSTLYTLYVALEFVGWVEPRDNTNFGLSALAVLSDLWATYFVICSNYLVAKDTGQW